METLKSIDSELIVTATAVIVAGMAAVLGMWMERDERKPPRYAWALSALILLATGVSLMQSFLDKKEQDEIKEDMARLLATMDKIASESNDPALLDLVKTELNAQNRQNPDVVQKVAARVEADGGDAQEMLGKHLDAADAEKHARKGSSKPRESKPKTEDAEPDTKATKQGVAAPAPKLDPAEAEAKRAAAQAAAAQAAAAIGGSARPVVPVPTPTLGKPAGAEATAAPGTPAAATPPAPGRGGLRGGPPAAAVRPGGKPAPKKPAGGMRKPKGK